MSTRPQRTVARLIVDLTDVVTIPHEITAVIHEAAHKGLFSLLGTLDAIERNPGRKTSLAREAIALYEAGSAGTKSGGEVQTVALFDAQGLPRPLVNTKLLGEEVDFHWPDRKLVITEILCRPVVKRRRYFHHVKLTRARPASRPPAGPVRRGSSSRRRS